MRRYAAGGNGAELRPHGRRGTAAHSDHARDLANTLLAAARGEAKDFKIKDVRKLNRVAGYLNINIEGKPVNKVPRKCSQVIEQFGQQNGELVYLSGSEAPSEIWRKFGIAPRASTASASRC